jgi:DNA-binding IclR family transcriptional regulator
MTATRIGLQNAMKRTRKPSSSSAKTEAARGGQDKRGAPAQSSPQRRGIQSVDIGFRVLTALAAEPEAATLGTIGKRAGLSPSQAHRYLSSLVASGMAHQHAASGRYELGPQAIQIGLAALARTDIFAEADPAIAAFTRETGRTTLLAARGPLGPTIVRWHAGRRPVVTSLSVGSVLPLFGSATGYVFVSFMNDDEVAGALDDEPTPSPLLDVAALRRRVRGSMYATVDELLIPGLRATAVPILDIQGHAALVATALATSAFSREEDDAIRGKLQGVCRTLTERFGAPWPLARS